MKMPIPYQKQGKGFVFPEYEPRYPRDPEYKLHHYILELKIYPKEKSVEGKAILKISKNNITRDAIEIDASEMEINRVEFDGEEVDYHYDGEKLTVYVGEKLASDPRDLIVEYKVIKPRFGLYFVASKDGSMDSLQVWSQGETEWNRYWMPIYDYPNNKASSEVIIWVPKELTAISNGVLHEYSVEGEWGVYHWVFNRPHSTYLIAIAVGKFDVEEEEAEGVVLYYYVPHGMRGYIKRSFQRTPDMIKFFNEYLGVKYPYENYKQVCVYDFVVGGMENTSLTILTKDTLHDEHAHMDFESEGLVAHELAHQWFGDLITCKDWSHIWLNESFATYLEALYRRHWKGYDEFIYRLIQDLDVYLSEYKRNYGRPLVYNLYKHSEEMFDAHSYPKGALILHTLANILGEDTFRRGLKEFLTRYAFKNVETEDLKKVLSEVSGLNLEWFFNQYIYNAGHPVIKARYKWDNKNKLIHISLEQVQDDNSPDVYRLPIEVAVFYDDKEERHSVLLEEKKQNIYLSSKKKPSYILIDPEFKVFSVINADYSLEDKIKILSQSRYVYWRILMARALAEEKSIKAINALAKSVEEDRFWAVSYESAISLGKVGGEDAKSALLRLIEKVENPRVRRGIVKALGNFRDEDAAKALLKVLSNGKESYFVRSDAAASLGKTKVEWGFEKLKEYLDTPSHMEVITRGCLMGMAEYRDERAKKIIMEYTDKSKNRWVRMVATQLLGKFSGDKDILDKLNELARDDDHRIQSAVANACRELMDLRAIPILEYIVRHPKMGWAYKNARITIEKIREHAEKGVEYRKLREELEKIREENRKLIERIERFEFSKS